jgi:choice-of-anchor A domain-containing protein
MRFVRPAALIALLATSTMSMAANPTAQDKAKAKAALTTLSQLNVFVKDTLTNSGGEIEGKVWVGNNLNGGNGFNIGFGASNGQSTVASTFATATVGGSQNAQIQIKNQVGGSYGAYIVGGSNGIEVQDNNGNVQVGGNVTGKISMSTGTSLTVTGNYTNGNGLSLGGNNNVWIGGSSTRIQGGNNNNIKVNGALSSLQLDSGSAQLGSTLGAGGESSSIKTNLTALGNISNLQMNDNGLVVKSGGTVSNISISNSSKVYAAGSIGVQNNNGGAGAVNANCGATFASCAGAGAAPTAPGVPTVASVSTETQTMYDNFTALQNALSHLATAGHTGTLSVTNGGQAYTFGSTATSGYTVFNVDETIFSKNEFAYNFANTTTPVIINVKNTGACTTTLTCSYTMSSNFTGNAGLYNQNVIWNFVDASSVVLNRQFQGSVLAALADLQSNVIEGSVVAKNFNQTNEIHLGTYNGNNGFILTGVIPEPANWAMLITGFGVVGGVVRRRRRSILTIA